MKPPVGSKANLRPVDPGEGVLLWRWVNDPDVRSASYHSQPISWEEHEAWFRQKRRDPHCCIYVVLDEKDAPIGQIRFDRVSAGDVHVDLSIAAEKRGQGYGLTALESACRRFREEMGPGTFLAFIKMENLASRRIFEKAGFILLERRRVHGCDSVVMALQ